jgi:YegS/Rv2252/BmrU family lipid kinase
MLDFIVNPSAGGEKGKKIIRTLKAVQQRLMERNVQYSIHYTTKKGDATTMTRDLIEKGATNIIVVGGDGTLHEVINGFTNFEKANMGIIPCGTGNDFAASIDLPFDPKDAIDLILDNTPKYTDFMQMPTVRGLNVIGTGMDVDVLKTYTKLKRKTKFGYTMSLVKTLFKFKCAELVAEFNEKKERLKTFVIGICNGFRYGGGLKICPTASPTDGKLDFVAVTSMNKLKIINAFINLKKGTVNKIKQYIHHQTTEIKIKTPAPCTVNVDGELYENIPFEVKIVPNTLRVYRK